MTQAEHNKNDPKKPGSGAEESVVDAFADALAQDSQSPIVNLELQSKINELQDRMIRMQADNENYRRRIQREQDDARKFESLGLLRDLLPGLDGLNRADAAGWHKNGRPAVSRHPEGPFSRTNRRAGKTVRPEFARSTDSNPICRT